jgi:predicted nucleic acid-binding protein
VSIYIDADVLANWEKGQFDLLAWIAQHQHPNELAMFPPTVWQQVLFGQFAWDPARAARRESFLDAIALPVSTFARPHARRAAQLAADLKLNTIGFADFQIAACAIEDGAQLLTFNRKHFSRVPGLRFLTP